MRAVVQRVSEASVRVDGIVSGAIGPGVMILLGVRNGDTRKEVTFLAGKCANLRIFSDEDGRFNLSLRDVGGAALVVPQFTLYGDARKGRRPSFVDAADPSVAEPLYEAFVAHLRRQDVAVETGVFGAMMAVQLVNDGPVTILLEREGAIA